MDIRNWPMDMIMQLPDSAFGRRWPIGLGFTMTGDGAVFDISDISLPDRMIIWGLSFAQHGGSTATNHLSLALGDVLPTSDAEFNLLELLFSSVKASDGEIGQFEAVTVNNNVVPLIRQPVNTNARRLVGRSIRHVGASLGIAVVLIVSSIPNEVSSWLNLEYPKSR